MEERLCEEWGLKEAISIKNKIFEGASERPTVRSLLPSEKLVVCSFALGKLLASYDVRLKAAQLRRFYESLLNIKATILSIRLMPNATELFQEKVLPEIFMLKPQLANAKARQPNEVSPFFEVINPLLDCVTSIEDYERLCRFSEAIVAYHKYCGGN